MLRARGETWGEKNEIIYLKRDLQNSETQTQINNLQGIKFL